MEFQNPLAGGETLVRNSLHSKNYVTGSTGWSINRDGSAEFNNVVVRNGVTVSGTDLYYNGTPAAGNLVASISSVAGVDSFGNHYLAGICAYDNVNNLYMQSNAGQVIYGALVSGIPDTTHVSLIQGTADLLLRLQSPFTTTFPKTAAIELGPGSQNDTVPGGNEPILSVFEPSGSSVTSMMISGAVIRTDLTGHPLTYQFPTYNSGWAGGAASGSWQGVELRLTADDFLYINGAMHTTSATPNINAFTLPVGYRPLSPQRIPALINASATPTPCWLDINTSGAVSVHTNPSVSGQDVYINALVDMGHIL